MPAGKHEGNTGFPGLLQQVEGENAERDGPEAQHEQGKGGQQFPHSIELESGKSDKEQPHPLPAMIFLNHYPNKLPFTQGPEDLYPKPMRGLKLTSETPDRRGYLPDLAY